MESYDYGVEDEQVTDEIYAGDFESMLDRLSRPLTKAEPEVSEDELQELDALADFVEIARLQQQGVLVAPEELGAQEVKRLSTKFVRSWREKHAVKQEAPTVVACVDATRRRQEFGLGRFLPGQRDGALM